MKTTLALVAALAATLGTAAAQTTGSPNTGSTTGGSGSSTTGGGTSHPSASKVNYKPGGGTKEVSKTSKNQITRSGGQGHNTTPPPKGKIQMAPTTPSKQGGATGSGNSETMQKNSAGKRQ
ncbi:hypothetical protein [Hymenobacter crusticola]|uniref:Uncharacterized protein n=1 Tax=Hymenobacter crusticola TaxID=1770526 RepID=A0A243WIM9_9BACT|nr:hypothetical protein [Hymenobacter crusticola]OUJ75745.1 hypothetical protein BXP70_00080 [Hymenobacter crusticola]